MKRIYTILTAALITASVFSQAPEKMSYQAVVRDAGNNLITNQTVGMQISILQGSATGTEVYVETQSPATNANGLVSIEIGTGTTSDDFSAIDWANGIYFIKTEIDPEGGTDYTITGTSQLLSVPYALYAKTAGDITETDLADILTNGNDGGAKQIKNIADPTDAQDAATKAYVDKKFQLLNIANSGVTDYDGNHYNALLIGNQIWMAENLRVTHYADGSEIDTSTPAPAQYTVAEWAALGVYDRAYCFYNNDTESEYGALYTYYAATAGDNSGTGVQGICPRWLAFTKRCRMGNFNK